MRFQSQHKKRRGFTLIEMAVVIVILGLAAGIVIKAQQTTQNAGSLTSQASGQNVSCTASTKAQLGKIRAAINHYVRVYNRYPAPAARNLGVAAAAYGTEDRTGSSIDHNNTNTVFFGSLPIKTLELPASFGADCWGNQFSYIVTEAMTADNALTTSADGVILINSTTTNTLTNKAVYAVISHGATGGLTGNGGLGRNYSGTNHGWCDNSTSPLDHNNCNTKVINVVLYSANFNDGANAGVNFFDDVMIYEAKQTTNCNGPFAAGTLTWTVGTNVCANDTVWNNSLANTAISANAIPDNSAPTTGTAYFQCNSGVMQAIYSNSTYPMTCTTQCPLTSVSWLTNCSGTLPQTIYTGSPTLAPINDDGTHSGYTGSATGSCQSDGTWSSTLTPDTCQSGTASCGSANGTTQASPPSSGLCATGNTASSVTGTTSYSWTCTFGGSTVNCSASQGTASCGTSSFSCNVGTSGSNMTVHGWGISNCITADNSTTNQIDCWKCTDSGGNVASCEVNHGAAPCSNSTLTWGAGCTGTTSGNTVSGSSASATNTASGYTGTGSATCTNGTFGAASGTCTAVTCPDSTLSWGSNCSATFTSTSAGQTENQNSEVGTGVGSAICNSDGTWGAASGSCSGATPVCGTTANTCNSGTPSNEYDQTCNAGFAGGWYATSWTCTLGANTIQCIVRYDQCFVADVSVTMVDGSKKLISELKAGDAVRGHTRINHVIRLAKHESDQAIYGFNGGDAFVTGGHPFYTAKGWKAIDPSLTPKEGHNVKTTKLVVGDVLLQEDGTPFIVHSIDETKDGQHALYSPVMDGDHTYFANGLLVHNKLSGTPPQGNQNPCTSCSQSCNGTCTGGQPACGTAGGGGGPI